MSTKTAKRIPTKALDDWRGYARLYRLSEPLDGNEYVVVSGISNEWATETYIFGADESGEITSWGELEGSFKGAIDHELALEGAGYEVTA